MNQSNDFLEAIKIIVDREIDKRASQIYTGLVAKVNGNKCDMLINGKTYSILVYGGKPTVNQVYPVFAPQGNMSAAFTIVP